MSFLNASRHPAKSGGKRAAVQSLREVWMRWANAPASGLRWLQHRFSLRGRSGSLVAGLLFVTGAAFAQANDDVPPLQPALKEIPPTVGEQYGVWIVILGVALLALLVVGIWWLLQPKPVVPVPIEIQTRLELEKLKQLAEDGKVVSRASQVLKRYVATAFELPPGEMTTTEFSRLVAGNEKVGAELASNVSEFLRQCDELKFSPVTGTQVSACARAWELFQAGELRRAKLREVVQPA